MITTKEKTFAEVSDYFDYMAETLGYPPYHRYFKSETVVSDGLKLHLDVYEHDKKAPTVVFVPGTAIYALCYAEMLYKLGQAGYNVIGLDPRGHGQSEGNRGDYTIPELMTDVENTISYAIERFNKKVSLMGSSQGGIVSFYMAAKDNRINSVICQNFADLMGEETTQLTRHPRLFKYLRLLIGGKAGELIPNAMIPMAAYIDLDSIPVKYFGSIRQFIENDPLALKNISIRALQSLGATPLAKPIDQITVPVMVFQGDADTIFSVDYTKKIYDQLTCKKSMIVFHDMTHALMSENVDDILPDILAWLAGIYNKKS
jgi:alpha-beta hydrolase superfamily lysophospholipase